MPKRESRSGTGTHFETRSKALDRFVLNQQALEFRVSHLAAFRGPEKPPGMTRLMVQKDSPETPQPGRDIQVSIGQPALNLLPQSRMHVSAGAQHPRKSLRHMDMPCQPTCKMRPRHVDRLGTDQMKPAVHQPHECRVLVIRTRICIRRSVTQQSPLGEHLQPFLDLRELRFVLDRRLLCQCIRSYRILQRPDDAFYNRVVRPARHLRQRGDRDPGTSPKRVASNSCPFDQRLPQQSVGLPPVIENRLDVLRQPSVTGLPPANRGFVMVRERVCRREPGALRTLRCQGIDHVAHDGIANAVADEYDSEFAEQFGDEPRCPLLGQIRPPEIRRRENQVRTVIIRHDSAMQMHEARPAVGLRHWQLRSRIDEPLLQSGLDEPVIEVGGDEANATLAPRQCDQRLMDIERTGRRPR